MHIQGKAVRRNSENFNLISRDPGLKVANAG